MKLILTDKTEITVTDDSTYSSLHVIAGGQSAGKMILKSLGDVPSADIPIRVIFRGEK